MIIKCITYIILLECWGYSIRLSVSIYDWPKSTLLTIIHTQVGYRRISHGRNWVGQDRGGASAHSDEEVCILPDAIRQLVSHNSQVFNWWLAVERRGQRQNDVADCVCIPVQSSARLMWSTYNQIQRLQPILFYIKASGPKLFQRFHLQDCPLLVKRHCDWSLNSL